MDFDLCAIDAVLDFRDSTLTIIFPEEATRNYFFDWLKEANAKAKQGYNSMWP
jgi:hypothetical protein